MSPRGWYFIVLTLFSVVCTVCPFDWVYSDLLHRQKTICVRLCLDHWSNVSNNRWNNNNNKKGRKRQPNLVFNYFWFCLFYIKQKKNIGCCLFLMHSLILVAVQLKLNVIFVLTICVWLMRITYFIVNGQVLWMLYAA